MNSLLDVGQMALCDAVDVGARQVSIASQAEQAANFIEAEAELAAARDEAQALDIA